MDPKYKVILTNNTDGTTKTVTVNHPKVDATVTNFNTAASGIEDLYSDSTVTSIILNSDTTVYTRQL